MLIVTFLIVILSMQMGNKSLRLV